MFLVSDLVLNSDLVLDPSDIIAVSKEIGNTLSGISNADTKWDEFAIELLGTEDFSQIKKNYTDFVDRCSALLKNWKNITEEPRWEQVVAVLRKIKLNGPAGKLNKALTSLKERGLRQLLQQEVGHTQGIQERIIAWANLGPTEKGATGCLGYNPLKVIG